jgi:hypothetical protein
MKQSLTWLNQIAQMRILIWKINHQIVSNNQNKLILNKRKLK